jgi:hypothetical protein
MADYKGIKGFKVQYLSADPSNPIIGQTWYNDTSKDLKYTGANLLQHAWATGNNLNTARASLAGAGTQTASLGFGGNTGAETGATERIRWLYLDKCPKVYEYCKKGVLAGCGTTNSSFRFWWLYWPSSYRCNRRI